MEKKERQNPMTYKWEKRIKDPPERPIFEAMSQPRWDFRTIKGIASATGISEIQVQKVVESHPDLIRKSRVPNKMGEALFTLQEKPIKLRERLAEVRTYLAGWAG